MKVYFTSQEDGLCAPQVRRRAGRLVPCARAQTSSAYAVSSLIPDSERCAAMGWTNTRLARVGRADIGKAVNASGVS